MKLTRKICVILAILFIIIFLKNITYATNIESYVELEGLKTANGSAQDYNTATGRVMSYLMTNSDGTITRVEALNSENERNILIEKYSNNYKLLSTQKIPFELTFFGGFYNGTQYNFVVFGQKNLDEDDNVEVLRIVKYSKNWERISSASIKGCNICIPFTSGACRMEENDETLYIETSRTMYETKEDGLHHQSNIGFEMTIDTMDVYYARKDIMNMSTGYVSHSFNQFIHAEDGYSYTVNHGDGYPRGIALIKRAKGAKYVSAAKNIMKFNGNWEWNATGATVGGFELSDNNCLIVGSSIDQDADNWNLNSNMDIFLIVCDKNDIEGNNQKTIWITDYRGKNEKKQPSTPHLIKINNNKFLIMWEEEDNLGLVKMLMIDGEGNKLTDIITMGGRLSDCKPIVHNNQVIWYVTLNNTKGMFFKVDFSSLESYNNLNVFDLNEIVKDFRPYFWLKTGSFEIYSYSGDKSVVDLSAANKLPIWARLEEVGEKCFAENKSITKVILPDTIQKIDDRAFYKCSNLKEVNLPKNLKRIGDYTFAYDWELHNITLPDGIEELWTGAFSNSGIIGNIRIPKSLKKLESNAFSYSDGINKLIFENQNLEMQTQFFVQNKRKIIKGKSDKPIEGIDFDSTKSNFPEYATVNSEGVVTAKEYTMGTVSISYYKNGVTVAIIMYDINLPGEFNYLPTDDGNISIVEYTEKSTNIDIPSKIDGKTVTEINVNAFIAPEGSEATTINIPSTVRTVNHSSYAITSYQGETAVTSTSQLKAINVDSKNTMYSSIDGVLYSKDGTQLIYYPPRKTDEIYTFPNTLKDLYADVIVDSKYLKEIVFPKNVEYIGYRSIIGCKKLEKIYIYNPDIQMYYSNTFPAINYCDNFKTICAYAGTKAEQYAKDASLTFVALKNPSKTTDSTSSGGNSSQSDNLSNSNANKVTNNTQNKLTPEKVTGVKNKTQGQKTITVNWNKVKNATGYELYMYDTTKKKYKKVETLTGTSYKVTGLKAATTYKFKVRAYRKFSGTKYYGEYSKVAKLTTTTKAPTISKLTSGKKKITVQNKKISGASGYQIQYSTNSKFKSGNKTTDTTSLSKTIKSLKSKKKYYVRIRTYRTVNGKKIYSNWSKVLNVKAK